MGEQTLDRFQSAKGWGRFLLHARKKIGAAASNNFWTRYALLAPLQAARAGMSKVSGSTTSGSTHSTNTLNDALKYVFSVFEDYKLIAGVDRFQGRVAEIGGGDSCGVALLFLADGCEQVDSVDRFYAPRNDAQQQEINRTIVSRQPRLSSHLLDDGFSEASFRGLQRHYGESAAAEIFFRQHNGYSAIVSRAVFEHLYNPLTALTSSARALAPGGIMVHCVDCRDHDLFSRQSHELKFLELSALLYAPFKWCGGPNRIRLSSYVDALRQEGLEYSIYIQRLAGVEKEFSATTKLEMIDKALIQKSQEYVASIRRHLAFPFSKMEDQNLMVQAFSIYARRT